MSGPDDPAVDGVDGPVSDTDVAPTPPSGPKEPATGPEEGSDAPEAVVSGVPSGTDDVLAARLRLVRRIAWVASACMVLGLFAYSVHIYHRFDLTTDFAIPDQAWSQIAHGHLSPYSTLNPYNYPHYGYPFWQDHFELIFWPLALLWFLYPHSIDLLVVQDVGLAGSVLVATLFLVDLIEVRWAHRRRTRAASRLPVGLAIGGLVALVINPWIYWSASFDFHLEALATLFLLLAHVTSGPEGTVGRWCGSPWCCSAGTSRPPTCSPSASVPCSPDGTSA